MGYYQGSGVVGNGGSSVSVLMSGPYYGGQFVIYQRVKSTVTVKPGVSLGTAQDANGDINLSSWEFESGAMKIPACKGTRTHASYSQIGDSNLYTLTTTSEELAVRGSRQAAGAANTTWVPTSGWST